MAITMILVIMIITPPVQVIAAEGEHKASRALRHAAEVIIDSPAALQVTMMTVVMTMMTMVTMIFIMMTMMTMMIILSPVEVPPDLEQHLRREQQYNHLPRPHRHHFRDDGKG